MAALPEVSKLLGTRRTIRNVEDTRIEFEHLYRVLDILFTRHAIEVNANDTVLGSTTAAELAALSGLGNSTLVKTDGSGNLADLSAPTLAEIAHVSGVTSALQTQLDTLTTAVNNRVRVLSSQYTASAVTGAGVIYTYTLPANTITADGQGIRMRCGGDRSGSTDNFTLRVRFGETPTSLGNSGYLSSNAEWFIGADIIRNSSSAIVYARFRSKEDDGETNTRVGTLASDIDWTASMSLEVYQASALGTDTITGRMFHVEFLPSAS